MLKGDNRKICNKTVIEHAHGGTRIENEVEIYATNTLMYLSSTHVCALSKL
jgi:hypothetical protein